MTEFLTYYFAPVLIIMMVNSLGASCTKKPPCKHQWIGQNNDATNKFCMICGERLEDQIFTFTCTSNEQEYWNQKYNDREL